MIIMIIMIIITILVRHHRIKHQRQNFFFKNKDKKNNKDEITSAARAILDATMTSMMNTSKRGNVTIVWMPTRKEFSLKIQSCYYVIICNHAFNIDNCVDVQEFSLKIQDFRVHEVATTQVLLIRNWLWTTWKVTIGGLVVLFPKIFIGTIYKLYLLQVYWWSPWSYMMQWSIYGARNSLMGTPP